MTTNLHESFLKLVRLGIGHTDTIDITDKVDWVAVKALADRQELSAVVLDGIDKLNTNLTNNTNTLSVQQKLEWIGEVLQNYEGRYRQYEKAIGSLAGWYNRHGYRMMVLKGYACSQDWPKPEHRPCGDIDVWLFGKQQEADAALAGNTDIRIDRSHHHHTVFEWMGFTVENHFDFIDVYHRKSSAGLEKIFKELGADDTYYVIVYGERAYVPSANLHALFLVYHTMLHFTSTEMTVRQILDWALFVDKHGENVDWEWLEKVVKEFHLWDFFNILNTICVRYLGFEAGIFPYDRIEPKMVERVMNDTLQPEFTGTEPAGLLSRAWFRYRRWKAHEWKHRLCYKESMTSIFLSGVWSHLLKPKTI